MPKRTFLNLPDEKRERFVAEALDEFARHAYDVASVSAIVGRLGIAKGSVYQYFDDKFDLFTWLLDEAGRRKLQTLGAHVHGAADDLYTRLHGLYSTGLAGWASEPRWQRLALRVLEPSKEPRIEDLRAKQKQMALEYISALLREGQRDGDVRTDIDVPTTAALLAGMLQQGLLDALFTTVGLDYTHMPDDPAVFAKIDSDVILGVVDTALDLVESMLRPPAEPPGG